jgi:hypothetical protein
MLMEKEGFAMSTAVRLVPPGSPRAHRSFGRRVRRTGVGVFFVSIAVNTGLAVSALVAPSFGDTQEKILGTSLCVTGAIVFALACEPAWERDLLGPVPYAGAALGSVGFGLAIAGIWSEPDVEVYGRIVGSVFAVAIACTLASLLALARLAPNHRWVWVVTLVLLSVGATMYAVVLWLGDDPSTIYLRAMGVVLVGFAAFGVTVPVLHWIDRAALMVAATNETVGFCPFCGAKVEDARGAVARCSRCGRGFTVQPIDVNLT